MKSDLTIWETEQVIHWLNANRSGSSTTFMWQLNQCRWKSTDDLFLKSDLNSNQKTTSNICAHYIPIQCHTIQFRQEESLLVLCCCSVRVCSSLASTEAFFVSEASLVCPCSTRAHTDTHTCTDALTHSLSRPQWMSLCYSFLLSPREHIPFFTY